MPQGTQKACIPSLCISGDTLGSVVYVPCEVMEQRMQVQRTMASWSSVVMKDNVAMKPGIQMYGYYTGMFHAGCSIWNEQGLRGLYAGYISKSIPLIFHGVIFSVWCSLPLLPSFLVHPVHHP